jgi:D-alanyl-D-alanine carboxypeptidase
VLASAVVDAHTLGPAVQRELGAQVATFFARDPVGGAVAGVVAGDTLAWSTAYGFADLESGTPVTLATVFRAASITKTLTATAVVQLRDDGALRLDDPLTAYLPEFAKASNPFGPIEDVTIRRLLSHEAGLPGEAPAFDWSHDRFPDIDEIAAAFDRLELVVPPESRVKYSNLGYQLLGEVIARVSGEPYAAALERRILRPLGMRESSFDPQGELRTRMATGYDARAFTDDLPRADDRPKGTLADGGLCTTLGDLATWAAFQLRGDDRVLSPASLAEMHRPRRVMDPRWIRAAGLGWYCTRHGDDVLVGHSGGTFGFVGRIVCSFRHDLAVVVLANGDAPVPALATRLLDTVAAGEPPSAGDAARAVPTLPVPVPPMFEGLLGLYAWEDLSFVMRVEWRAGRLTLARGVGTAEEQLLSLAPTGDPFEFVVEDGRPAGERLRFLRGVDGGVDGFSLGGWPLVRLVPARPPKSPRGAPPDVAPPGHEARM